jgi:hypothetical protein
VNIQDVVSYSVETSYNEPADFAQLVVKRFTKSPTGLFAPCADEPTFFTVSIEGQPLRNAEMVLGTPTTYGFIIPTEDDVEVLRQELAQFQFLTLVASNGAELSDQVTASLNWAKRHIRSLQGYQMVGGPCGTPNPDPAAAEIVLHTCKRWTSDTETDLDAELNRLLSGGNEADGE